MSSGNASMYPLAQQLLRASAKGELHRVIQLINDGATVAVNKHGRTALHIAAHRGFLDIVRILLQNGCNPDIQDDNGDTALQRAVAAGNDFIVQRLLDEACAVDCQNKYGDSALHGAARCGHHRILKLLVNANGSTDCLNKNGDLPLHMACANGHVNAATLLMSVTPELMKSNNQGDTPLHLAVRFGHVACTKALIASKCNVDIQNQFGNTPLHIAVLTQNTTLARILLNAAAQAKKILNREGKSAVDVAREVDNGELVIMLLSGPRPPVRRRGRKVTRTTQKSRSSSEPRGAYSAQSDKCDSCDWAPSGERVSTSCKQKRGASSRSHSRSGSRVRKPREPASEQSSPGPHHIDEYHRKLTVNPYVVPQLYSLHRDRNGDIYQTPVVEQLPNPTPQIVSDLHQSIQQARNDLERNFAQTNSLMLQKVHDLQERTEYQFRALDRLTSERIRAERTMCLHRIEQQAAYHRMLAEEAALARLDELIGRGWSRGSAPSRCCDCKESAASDEFENSFHDSCLPISDTGPVKASLPAARPVVEARSVDSGVSVALFKGLVPPGTPEKRSSDRVCRSCDAARDVSIPTEVDCRISARSVDDAAQPVEAAGPSSHRLPDRVSEPHLVPRKFYGVRRTLKKCGDLATPSRDNPYDRESVWDATAVHMQDNRGKRGDRNSYRSRDETSTGSLLSEDLVIIDQLREVSLKCSTAL